MLAVKVLIVVVETVVILRCRRSLLLLALRLGLLHILLVLFARLTVVLLLLPAFTTALILSRILLFRLFVAALSGISVCASSRVIAPLLIVLVLILLATMLLIYFPLVVLSLHGMLLMIKLVVLGLLHDAGAASVIIVSVKHAATRFPRIVTTRLVLDSIRLLAGALV